MKQTLLLLSSILLFTIFGCSQRYGINKNYAFSRTTVAGTIPVDQQGKPQDNGVKKTYLIYLEIEDTVSKPRWDTAWIGNSAFTIAPFKIEQDSITIGKTATNQESVSLSARPGYILWQLLLTPLLRSPQSNTLSKNAATDEVVLSGLWKTKRVRYSIKGVTELEKLFME